MIDDHDFWISTFAVRSRLLSFPVKFELFVSTSLEFGDAGFIVYHTFVLCRSRGILASKDRSLPKSLVFLMMAPKPPEMNDSGVWLVKPWVFLIPTLTTYLHGPSLSLCRKLLKGTEFDCA
jgi:hypothetical protein